MPIWKALFLAVRPTPSFSILILTKLHPDSIWRHKFFPLVNSILLVVQRPGSVKYSEILALERELRFCRMPEELEACHISPMANTLTDLDITKHLQGITALMWRESGEYNHSTFLYVTEFLLPLQPVQCSIVVS